MRIFEIELKDHKVLLRYKKNLLEHIEQFNLISDKDDFSVIKKSVRKAIYDILPNAEIDVQKIKTFLTSTSEVSSAFNELIVSSYGVAEA